MSNGLKFLRINPRQGIEEKIKEIGKPVFKLTKELKKFLESSYGRKMVSAALLYSNTFKFAGKTYDLYDLKKYIDFQQLAYQ